MDCNIVSSLSVDNYQKDDRVKYPLIGKKSFQEKRTIYWKCAYVFFYNSIRINSTFNHLLFTNDDKSFVLDGFNFQKEIEKLGVEIRYLPFSTYYILGELSKAFKNAYYKFEVIHALKNEMHNSILMDLDCIWVNKIEELNLCFNEYDYLLYDPYKEARGGDPFKKHPHDISMKDMGDVYRKFDENYPVRYPVWYGGEFIGAKPEGFEVLDRYIKKSFNKVISDIKEEKYYFFPNGDTLLDGDEYISNYVLNCLSVKRLILNKYIKRIWTRTEENNAQKSDLNLAIWHLLNEKMYGFDTFFEKIKRNHDKSIFDSNLEIGKYFNIPNKSFKYSFISNYRHWIKKFKKLLSQ